MNFSVGGGEEYFKKSEGVGKIEKIGKTEVENECIGARASDNFITLNDLVAVLAYYGLAYLLLL